MRKSEWEENLAAQMRCVGLKFEREFYAIPKRRYRWDFAFPKHKLLIEVQGGIWSRGKSGHTSGRGVQRDCEKSNEATILGWRTLKVTSDHIRSGQAIQWITQAIGG